MVLAQPLTPLDPPRGRAERARRSALGLDLAAWPARNSPELSQEGRMGW
jgi:hypothetical protein